MGLEPPLGALPQRPGEARRLLPGRGRALIGLPFEVGVVEPMGSHLLLTGTIDGQRARIVAPPIARVAAGDRVGLDLDPSRLTWIDAATGRAMARV